MAVEASPAAFLAARRFALAGASRGGRKFGNTLLRELLKRNLPVLPVHPEAAELEGLPCVPSLRDLPQPVEALVVCLPPARVPDMLRQAREAGIAHIWLQQGSVSPEALALGRQLGLEVVAGECLLLHLEPVRGPHALHRWLWRLLGKLPRQA